MRRFVPVVFVALASCANPDPPEGVTKAFYEQPPTVQQAQLRQYTLDQQYKIFRYGNDVIHPPEIWLANPIAERGAAAVPLLLRELHNNTDQITVRDILQIFETMARTGSYDVKSDQNVMSALSASVDAIAGRLWYDVCAEMLQRIKED